MPAPNVLIIKKEINGVSYRLNGVLIHNWLIMPDDIIQSSEGYIEILIRSLATRINVVSYTSLILNWDGTAHEYIGTGKVLEDIMTDLRDRIFISNLISA